MFILDALSKYKAADAREAENIVERVTPRLQHANCAVVLSAVKVGLFPSFFTNFFKKLCFCMISIAKLDISSIVIIWRCR